MGKTFLNRKFGMKISNDNGVRVVNFATSKNLTVKSTMFPHRNIHKILERLQMGIPAIRLTVLVDSIKLVDRRRHSNILVLDVRTYRAEDCDTDRYVVLLKVRERLSVNKERSYRFHMGRSNLK
jgi:hypothetical protein